jgi:polyhydroxyalkanoate synthase subunit PhaC
MLSITNQKEMFSDMVSNQTNPFFDCYFRWLDLSVRYNIAVFEASTKAAESFFNFNKPRTEKSIENDIRLSFDTSLRESLKEESFAKSLSEYVDAFVNLQTVLGRSEAFRYRADFIRDLNNRLEFLRTTLYRTPSETIKLNSNFELLHYISSEKKYKTPILIVGSLINRYYILDLLPKFSVIRNLLRQGFDVYATEWTTPSNLDYDMTLENYARDFLETAIEKVKEMSGSDKISLLGYCWGGIFALIYSAIHPQNVKNLILHSTPLDSNANPTPVEIWTSHLNVDRDLDIMRNMPGSFVNLAFLFRNPLEPILKWPRFFSEPRSIDEIMQFFAVEMWLYDSRSIIGGVYRKIVKDIYQKNLLIKNKMELGGKLVDLQKITMPVLSIIATHDDLVPPESSKSIMKVIPSSDKQLIEFQSGHTGICMSTRAHEQLWPQVGKWLSERS